ncbi:probable ATP-dependent RNA helicase DDX31 isoform X7 [Phacochoerus africanus]|uniref:probable ATP-dependent RNA helicase DDX31 isoform X7 n=1 Tax=Phacochoerus africanus TaxID=41426 RepID=UPI001FD8F68F|nr:probable ATP-dependent RNA helicase DDX31 isoform X7 [Phacochoerus africanus]
MAAAGGALLHVPEPRAAAPRTFSRPRPAQARQRAAATKRRNQASREAPPAKRRSEASLPPARATDAKENPRAFKGKAQKAFSPETSSAGASDGSRERKPGVKTSSLFRNNPEIPALLRPAVKQRQESVFSSDAFQALDLHPHLISTINTVLKMSSLTSIQKQSIPVLLEGRDALVRSQTGSGKTLAYCVPMVQSLQAVKPKIQRGDGPYALILVPTRELALQSFDTVQKLLKPFTWIVPGVLMGGEKRKSEKARLRKGINILISTPGRLVDHIKSTKNMHFCRIRWLILDEADRILDLGFEKDIALILNAVNAERPERQNVLLSATLTEGVTRLADISLHEPVRISVLEGSQDQMHPKSRATLGASPPAASSEPDGFAIPVGLEQHVVLVPSKLRLVSLAAFILQKCKFEPDQKVIVFFSSCELVEFHHSLFLQTLLGGSGALAPGRLPSASPPLTFLRLHGDMEQEERTAVFQEFSRSKAGVLLCTDVAARGLDLPQVTWIVQNTSTGLGGLPGLASRGAACSFWLLRRQNMSTRWLLTKSTLQSFVRAYATYPRELKHIFHVRSLHLGHVAKSFGLRDAPKNLSTSALKKKKAHLRRPDPRRKTQSKHRLAELLRSEYSSGMGASGAKVKRPNKRAGPGSAACAQRPALAVGQK